MSISFSSSSKAQHGTKRFIDLATLPADVAEALKEFDEDGDGDVTLDEVRLGALALRETKKKNKNLSWIILGLLLGMIVIVGSLSGIMHQQFQKNKDTVVDPTTGNLMVNAANSLNNPEDPSSRVEVSTKSHGTSFHEDGTIVDEQGDTVSCVSSPKIVDLFLASAEGTPVNLGVNDGASFAVHHLNGAADSSSSLGKGGSEWTNTYTRIGDTKFFPSKECAAVRPECTAIPEGGSGRHRALSDAELLSHHQRLKHHVIALSFGGGASRHQTRDNRRLAPAADDVVEEGENTCAMYASKLVKGKDEKDMDAMYNHLKEYQNVDFTIIDKNNATVSYRNIIYIYIIHVYTNAHNVNTRDINSFFGSFHVRYFISFQVGVIGACSPTIVGSIVLQKNKDGDGVEKEGMKARIVWNEVTEHI